MIKIMLIVAVAMLAAICQGTVVHPGVQDSSNVDCSYAENVMRRAEAKKIKLSDDDKRMIEVARVHCSMFATSSKEEGRVVRQGGTGEVPFARPVPGLVPFTRPPVLIPFTPLTCSCRCVDKRWAERECGYALQVSALRRAAPQRCIVTTRNCSGGKWMCCGARH